MTSLHIIYKSGKFTVPVVASVSMLEVLKKGCQHFKIDESYHQLMYGNINVNLSLPYRLSGIPNLSRVTITEKKGQSVSTIKIAIQMTDGKRYQSNFKTNSTLWDILLFFQTNEKLSIIDKFNDENKYIEPIINILNREVTTIELLQKSSLSSLNVTESSLIKLTFKQTDRTKDEILPIIESYQPPQNITPTPSPTPSPTTTTTTNTNNNNNNNTNITSPTSSTNSNLSNNSSPTIINNNNNNIIPSPTNSASSKSSINSNENIQIENNKISPIINNTIDNTKNLKKENEKEKEKEIPKIITMDPKDRELKVYTPTLVHINPKNISHNEKLTEDDFKRLVEANKRVKKEKDEFDSVLRTKSMREREEYKKLKNFQTTIIRLVLPGNSQKSLEMKFLVREKISNLIEYLNTLLSEKNNLFLYTTPPYKILDNNISFLKEGLFPRAKIYLGVQNGENVSFNEEVQKLFNDSSLNTSPSTNTTTTTTTISDDSMNTNDDDNDKDEKFNDYDDHEEKQRERERELEMEKERTKTSNSNNNQPKVPSWFLKGKQ